MLATVWYYFYTAQNEIIETPASPAHKTVTVESA